MLTWAIADSPLQTYALSALTAFILHTLSVTLTYFSQLFNDKAQKSKKTEESLTKQKRKGQSKTLKCRKMQKWLFWNISLLAMYPLLKDFWIFFILLIYYDFLCD